MKNYISYKRNIWTNTGITWNPEEKENALQAKSSYRDSFHSLYSVQRRVSKLNLSERRRFP